MADAQKRWPVGRLSVRSGSLADANQLNAPLRPRPLSSLQTNPVRQAAAGGGGGGDGGTAPEEAKKKKNP